MHYYPSEDILVEIVAQFNKHNETTIGHMRNQYNALEKYVLAYCKDHNKYLVDRWSGNDTGINFKFRSALFDAVLSVRGLGLVLNSREVSTLSHFSPLIEDDNSQSTHVHEQFCASYQRYVANPLDARQQKTVFSDLCKLLYVVRCNSAHTGKSSFGPNRAKIERDNSVARLIVSINQLIFNVIMDRPDKKLACYGTLVSSPFTEKFTAVNGKVNGYLETSNDGIKYFTYELETGTVDVKLYKNNSPIDFSDIDAYEGTAYERILIPVKCGNEVHIANIYERRYSYE